MISENLLKMLSGIFVIIYIARYLGPEQFGFLSYTLTIISIVKVISKLGLDSVLVREIANAPHKAASYTNTAFIMMGITSLIGIIFVSLLVYFFESNERIQLYIWCIACSVLFQSFLVIDFKFQALLKSKYGFIAKSISYAVSSIVKIYLVVIEVDILYLVWSYVFDAIFLALMLVISNRYIRHQPLKCVLNRELVKPLLKSALPMIISAASALLYMRIDQVMIKHMLDTSQLGLYASSAKIFEGWVMLSYIISVSLLPTIIKLKTHSKEVYENSLIILFRVLVWLGLAFALMTFLFSELMITATFGAQFLEAKYSLSILMCAAPLIALRTLSVRYLIAEGYENKIAHRTIITLIINVLMNMILIPVYGIAGAAYSTLISLFIGSYAINYMDQDLNQLRRICNAVFFIRYTGKGSKV